MAEFDPRLTPARPDLAAKHLEGKVQAARFVEGMPYEVNDPVVPVRRVVPRPPLLVCSAIGGPLRPHG